jgi:hypothetical protein
MTPREMLHELDTFSYRIAAAASAQEVDSIISDARARLVACGQNATRAAPTKENEMRFLAFTKLEGLKEK